MSLAGANVRDSWSLTRVEDRAGNTIEVTYSGGEPWGTTVVPLEIRYTGSLSGAYDPQRSVRFFYSQHLIDTPDMYLSGITFWPKIRLEWIEMWGPNIQQPDLLRMYQMAYRYDSITGKGLLTGIRECDGWPRIRQSPAYSSPRVRKEASPALDCGEYYWSCLLIASVIKYAVLRYGGYRLNRRVMPFMFGIILGESSTGAFWSLLSLFLNHGRFINIKTYDFCLG